MLVQREGERISPFYFSWSTRTRCFGEYLFACVNDLCDDCLEVFEDVRSHTEDKRHPNGCLLSWYQTIDIGEFLDSQFI